ncbi:uncharacterized protein si:dkeyp-61b2.1 [Xyrauchen texanus]|uniref:uncharacterized protein si:dkeyp-61b2.1 n=1 Tax=Xyrauchen texanus TaxID=154827 RepID=UPI002241BB8E|nr:uncharacterized protein si:dkeyp-61b2.1 [Xyrauchen texanus]
MPGTFSSKPSLSSTCTPHTDCARLGMIVLTEGTATQDRECGHPVTTPTPSIIITTISSSTDSTLSPSTTDFTTQTTPNFITIKPITSPSMSRHSFRSQQKPSSPLATETHRLYLRSTTETTSSPKLDANTSMSEDFISSETLSSVLPLWILLLILLLVMTSICLFRKRTAQKTIAKCAGFLSAQHEDQYISSNFQSQTSEDRKVEAELLHGSDVRENRTQNMGLMSPSGGVQQVSNGKGENVSNTVGSIYIYSPGTVILGSNSGDKQEEAKVFEENVPLISTPQQESTPPSNEIRIRMSAQEETEEELSLSFPVPATGK